MTGNVYDDNDFFEAYAAMPRSKIGLEAAGEWHQLKSLFPDVRGKKVLDLGCGYGWHCKYAIQAGAAAVLGLDSSKRMIHTAMAENADKRITYQRCRLDEYDYPENTYDLVLSNLALHYVEDLEGVYRKVMCTLKKGGCFLFNIEHPVFTAGVNEDWVYHDDGTVRYWPVDNYFFSGARETIFLGRKVVKQHHTLTQILNPLIQNGFQLATIDEAVPPETMRDLPGMADELRRPMMLLVKAIKPR